MIGDEIPLFMPLFAQPVDNSFIQIWWARASRRRRASIITRFHVSSFRSNYLWRCWWLLILIPVLHRVCRRQATQSSSNLDKSPLSHAAQHSPGCKGSLQMAADLWQKLQFWQFFAIFFWVTSSPFMRHTWRAFHTRTDACKVSMF